MRFLRMPNLRTCLIVGLCLVLISNVSGQSSKDNFLKRLTAAAALTGNELGALANGNPVVKVLPSRDKREVSVFGAVRLIATEEIDLAGFRAGLSQRNNKAMLGGGTLSTEPGLKDLAGLTLDDGDVVTIKTCVPGNCDLKLSASMIQRFRTEIDWNAADQKRAATELFKIMLVDYVRDYLKRGDGGLLEYADKRKPMRLADEYRTIMEDSTLIGSFAPELTAYLRRFPADKRPGIESRIDWSRVDSGLKPIITLTHSVGYSKRSEDDLLLAIATKQIYASHYIDASLAFTSFVRFGTGGSIEAYLVFASISRSDSLGGALSRMAHAVVEREALEKAGDLLRNSKMRLEAKTPISQKPDNETPDSGVFSTVIEVSQSWIARIFAILIVGALTLLIVFRWRAGK